VPVESSAVKDGSGTRTRWFGKTGRWTKFGGLSLPGGVSRPRGSVGATWAPLALNFLSRVGGARGGPHASGFGFYFGTEEFEMCRILLNL